MISLPKLNSLARERRFEDLLEEVTRNGRPLPLEIRLRLSEPEAAPIAGLSLAIQRVCELTYRPTPVLIGLAERLLEFQKPDGTFGAPACTALAFAALDDIESQLSALPGEASPRYIDADLAGAIERAASEALASLVRAQRASRRALIGDDIDTTVALWRLLDSPRFGRAIDLPALVDAAGACGLRHRRSTAGLLGRWEHHGEPARKAGSLFAFA